MDRVLRWKGHLRPVAVGDDQLVLIGERQRFLVQGRASVLAASLLDGTRTVEDVVLALPHLPPLEVLYAVESLDRQGYLVGAQPDGAEPPPEHRAFWEALGVPGASARERLETAHVDVTALGEADVLPLVLALRNAGLKLTDPPNVPSARPPNGLSLHVLVVDDYLQPAVEQHNREALRRGEPFLLVKPRGVVPWIGPVFAPGQGPCWECLAHRLRANRPVETYLQQQQLDPPPGAGPAARLALSEQVALGLAALAIAEWIALGPDTALGAGLLELDLETLALRQHPVIRRARCTACGNPPSCTPSRLPVRLVSRQKRFVADGGHRIATPREVHERLQPHISPITGVVSSVGPVPGRDHPLRPVYGASWFTQPGGERLTHDAFHRTSLGKGRSAEQARASALGEAIERWSAQLQGDEPRVRASLSELGGAAVHPADLLHFSPAQYRRRKQLNARSRERAEFVPMPYAGRPIDWTPVWSLDEQRTRYVPTSFCYAELAVPEPELVCPYDSNGDAAGSCLEEAILQGLLEVVERDAAGIWWYSRARRPGVALESFGEPYFIELKRSFEQTGWRLWVLDLTTDLELPCFVAYSELPGTEQFSIGFGCHLDPRLAVLRALTENNQLFDPTGERPLPWRSSEIADASYLVPDPSRRSRSAQDYAAAQADGEDLCAEIQYCIDRVRSCGMTALVLDRSREEVPMSVAKVVVPGLRHFWPRFGPGRLYEVPVQLGWVSRPLTEAELNPVPLLI